MDHHDNPQARRTLAAAGYAENLVSTACPECDTRYAMLARYDLTGWHLRCTVCGWAGDGELKPKAKEGAGNDNRAADHPGAG